MRILLGVPTMGHPTNEFLASIARLRLPQSCTAFDRFTVTGNFVPAQRELIVRRALAGNADYVLMIDDDMVVPPDALEALLLASAESDVAIAGALYYTRDGIRPMVAQDWSSTQTTSASIPAFDSVPVAVDALGFGCVLLRLSALRMLAPPFFGAQVYIETAAARVRLCNEDFLLCERLREAGYRIMLHPGVRCGHVDRESGRIVPEAWEIPSVTNRRRMIISEPGPRFTLVDYDPSVAQAAERHDDAALTYLTVE